MTDRSFGVLVRGFLDGFFESDLLPDTVDPKQGLVGVFAVVLTPTLWLAFQAMLTGQVHHVVWRQAVERGTTAQIYARFEVASWGSELLLTLYVMAVVGFAAFLVWDRVFPDRRDLMVLGTLPLSTKTLVTAKLSALVIVIGGLVLALCVPMALGMAVGALSPVVWMPLRYLAANLIVMPAAGLFVFFGVIAAQTVLGTFLRTRLLREVSVICQLICMVLTFEMLVFSRPVSFWLAENALGLSAGPLAPWLPPLWFLGLFETILGTEHAVFHRTAMFAVLAFGISVATVLIACLVSYRHAVQRVMESTEPSRGDPAWLRRVVYDLVYGVLVRRPTQQAVVMFVVASVTRNQRYKLLLALYVGVGLAFIMAGALLTLSDGSELNVAAPTVLLLSIPLLLSFFALVGLRVLFTVPTELRANWVFQLSETPDTGSYIRGVRKAMVLLALPPLVLATLPIYWWLWGPAVGLAHTAFWVVLGLVLVEVLLIGLHRVPFTCTYVPGKANVKLLWWLYLLAMMAYAYQTARVEVWLLSDPTRYTIGVAVLATAVLVARLARVRFDRPADSLVFEDAEAPAVQTLHLMPPV